MIAERVEQPPTRVARGGVTVLALVEKQTGLLPSSKIDLILDRPSRTDTESGIAPAGPRSTARDLRARGPSGSLRARMPAGASSSAWT